MAKIFIRDSFRFNTLNEESDTSLKMISAWMGDFLFSDSPAIPKRCVSKVVNGKKRLRELLDDARKVIFTKKDLINWLYKTREDAKKETDSIFLEVTSSIGSDLDSVDLERIGFLNGIYQECERYLNIIISTESTDKNKPNHQILDRLEEIDENFINTNRIAGFYSVQEHSKIVKHKHELKNLDDYWKDYLSFKDKHSVGKGFGDLRHLQNQYHQEFKWTLVRIRPREDVKEFLSYHMSKYEGESSDFLNHIEYRIVDSLDGLAGSDYPIYNQVIFEWLKEQRGHLSQESVGFLIEAVISATAIFLDNVEEYKKSEEENKFNLLICGFLHSSVKHRFWTVKDQPMGGSTNTNLNSSKGGIAFRDLIVSNENGNHVSAIECFRLKSIPKNTTADQVIQPHLTKIFKNEPIGLSPLFIIVYCETQRFFETWKKYCDYVSKIDFGNYQNVSLEILDGNPPRANLNVAKATHYRENRAIEVYHIFINMNP